MILRLYNIILMFALSLALLSCGPSENERLEKEVLDIHDEVMPWLDDMKAIRRQLITSQFETKADSIKAKVASKALHQSDSLMWTWMYQYVVVDNLRDSMTEDQIHSYLLYQKEYIVHVNTSMKDAVKLAEELLEL